MSAQSLTLPVGDTISPFARFAGDALPGRNFLSRNLRSGRDNSETENFLLMPAEKVLSELPSSMSHPLIRRLSDVAPSAGLTVIGDRFPTVGPIRGFGRAMRERFQAMTGLGLSSPRSGSEPPRRNSIAPRDGAPTVSYLEAGDPLGQRVVFVHGTPGTAADWAPFLQAPATGQRRLAIDRPGFGGSGPRESVVSLSEQARAIAALLDDTGGPTVVVGSSYGGPVALRLAADRPDLVTGLLLVGGAADPSRETVHPFQHLAALAPMAAILPTALAQSNAELLALRGELEILAGDLARIRAAVTILHGLGDTLVPAENASYLAERLTGAERLRFILVAHAGHFLHLLSPDHVEDALADLLSLSTVRNHPTA
jgi:pimeloyl-ACP methyl ester carboxylesterase